MLFGAVVSATDPVAVVALLKDLGASKKLGTLIEGESLLNDGTAIVGFVLLIGVVTGSQVFTGTGSFIGSCSYRIWARLEQRVVNRSFPWIDCNPLGSKSI